MYLIEKTSLGYCCWENYGTEAAKLVWWAINTDLDYRAVICSKGLPVAVMTLKKRKGGRYAA